MSVRRLRPLAEPAPRIALELKRSEGAVALLDRVRPLNWAAELGRLTRALETGMPSPPAFEYAPRAQLGELRGRLTQLARTLDAADPEQGLLAERALELELEAALAEHVGTADFAELAARRFPLPEEPKPVDRCAEQLLTARVDANEESAARLHRSDDANDAESLWSQVSKLLSRERWPVRIELVPGLVSLAAVAEGVVRIRPGARLGAGTARRIALHEVEGHLRPRVQGRSLGGAFVAGTARASEDEEGRAILLEERAGLLDSVRRKELARRYLAAQSVRQGAEFWETVTLLGRSGASVTAAVELACRVHRGGGLGRELVYLTGYLRVAGALAVRPGLEGVLESGRISLSAAETLLAGSIELDDDRNVV